MWLLAQWRKVCWASSLAFLLVVIGAGYGVLNGYGINWMLLGTPGGSIGWDLSDFARRVSYAAPTDDIRLMERCHLARVGVVAALGFGHAGLSAAIRIKRLAFELAGDLVTYTQRRDFIRYRSIGLLPDSKEYAETAGGARCHVPC